MKTLLFIFKIIKIAVILLSYSWERLLKMVRQMYFEPRHFVVGLMQDSLEKSNDTIVIAFN